MSKKKDPMKKKIFAFSRADLYNLLGSEKLRMELCLILARGNIPKAAQVMGMSERHIFRKINQYDLDIDQIRTEFNPIKP